MSLYLKYTPSSLNEVGGNVATYKALTSVIGKEGHIQCFLFTGDKGVGKTMSARLLAKELNAEIREINASDDRGIDTIREVVDECRYAMGKMLYIFDECHQLSAPAQEALLKIMQDTPKDIYFAFCTTNPEKLKAPFKSRCHLVALQPLNYKDMARLIKSVTVSEGITISADVLDDIIYLSEGSPRLALVHLESVLGLTEEDALDILRGNNQEEKPHIELCRLLLSERPQWSSFIKILETVSETEPIRQMVLSYMSSVLLKGVNPRAAKAIAEFKEPFFNSGKAGLILAFYKCLQ